MTGALQAFVELKLTPEPFHFWDIVKTSGQKLQDCVSYLLNAAASYFNSTHFTEITSAMNEIVNATTIFRNNIQGSLHDQQITFDTLTAELEGIFMTIVNDLKKIPPPDKAPGHPERAEMVDKVLHDTTQALTKLATRYGFQEEAVTTYMLVLKPHVHALVVAVGDINEQHPELLSFLVFSVAILLVPEAWILRSFLSVFGFGPAGPIKGSPAAWMQSRFLGGTVKSGSWFSWLQSAGMLSRWNGFVTTIPLLIGLILLPCLLCHNRG
ncbi:hypothetical protein V8E55_002461 [Tylopilus felleus]